MCKSYRIKTKNDLKETIYADIKANDVKNGQIKTKIHEYAGINKSLIIKYLIFLRKWEFHINNKERSVFHLLLSKYYMVRCENLGRKLSFEIPPNVFGPGLKITHLGLRIVNGDARVGKNCLVHSDVNIGTNGGNKLVGAPKLGNNVYIGPGVKIFGDIEIADNIAIGANSVVNKSFLEPGITIAGIPAKKVSNKGSYGKVPEDN